MMVPWPKKLILLNPKTVVSFKLNLKLNSIYEIRKASDSVLDCYLQHPHSHFTRDLGLLLCFPWYAVTQTVLQTVSATLVGTRSNFPVKKDDN